MGDFDFAQLRRAVEEHHRLELLYVRVLASASLHFHSKLTYKTNAKPAPCRFVSIQVDFVSEDGSQSHRYCSRPAYFDVYACSTLPSILLARERATNSAK